MVSSLTRKGQLTLPLAVRRRLKLKPGDKVDLVVHSDGRLEAIPLRGSVRDLKGSVPRPRKAVSLAAMERAIREAANA